MDQIACAHGGIVRIDFENEQSPSLTSMDFDFAARGYVVAVVNTGSSHADLTEDYASVPEDMRSVATALGAARCRETSLRDLFGRLQELRGLVGDRALLRAIHFHQENERVDEIITAVRADDVEVYLEGVRASGSSSWRLLQNYAPTGGTVEQAIALAAAVVELAFPRAAVRVHGGGFAGAVQAYVPEDEFAAFREEMERLFGGGVVTPLRIRSVPAGPLLPLPE
jgi:galactokinase